MKLMSILKTERLELEKCKRQVLVGCLKSQYNMEDLAIASIEELYDLRRGIVLNNKQIIEKIPIERIKELWHGEIPEDLL